MSTGKNQVTQHTHYQQLRDREACNDSPDTQVAPKKYCKMYTYGTYFKVYIVKRWSDNIMD